MHSIPQPHDRVDLRVIEAFWIGVYIVPPPRVHVIPHRVDKDCHPRHGRTIASEFANVMGMELQGQRKRRRR